MASGYVFVNTCECVYINCARTYPNFVALFTAVSMLMPTLNAKYTAGISLL